MLIRAVGGKIICVVKDTLEVVAAFSLEKWERVLVQYSACAVKLAFALVQQSQLRLW
jgi:hypothetical protein